MGRNNVNNIQSKERLGEERINNFGSKMIISRYNKSDDIDVYFPEYNWIYKHTEYGKFKKGCLKCSYEPRVYEHGYIGEGKYKVRENGELTKYYRTWYSMLQRCYDDKLHKRYPTYDKCKLYEPWLNFQIFAEWMENNYYEIEGEIMCLDKDILIKGNKIYSPETCIFVPKRINSLFIKCDKLRGDCPIGVRYNKRENLYIARCNDKNGKETHLKRCLTKEEAFYIYKKFKEKVIKEVADEYKDLIPEKLYVAMYNYEVEIND